MARLAPEKRIRHPPAKCTLSDDALDEGYMHYYQHHIGDFIKATARLTDGQTMAYLRLIWMYYDSEKPLKPDTKLLAFQIGSTVEETELLLESYFWLAENGWHHTRCDKEIAFYRQQLEKASKAGKASAAKRAMNVKITDDQQAFNGRSTDVQPTNNQEPITNNQLIKQSSASSLKPEDVSDVVWSDFLALRKANKSPLTETALKGIKREAVNAGMTLEKVLQLCCARGWRGFKAEWVTEEVKKDDLYKQNIEAIFGKRREIDITPQQDFLEG